MPRYAYQTPRARVYSYNYGYMNNYYKPMTHYVEKSERAVSEQPGHQSLAEVTPKKEHRPLWMKHPYRLPIDDVHTAPHESSIWPEKVPHFNLVSSYDLMCGYLGLKEPRTVEI